MPHLGLRAAMALGLLVGFYVLALTLSLGLFALAGLIVYLSIQHHRTPAVLLAALVLVGAGFAVLRGAITSARIRTGGEAPLGIPTSPATEPRLWAEVGQLADLVEARAPAEIHLVPGVNAFVHQESRLLGMVRGKVVLGVGLGLLSVLDRDGLRSVLAHELGHISARDTRLGPLTYRARFAILRTVETLEDRRTPFRKELARLFRGYFRLFMRFSMAVSRAQERAADRASVRAAGAPAAARALETIGIADHAFDFFTDRYVVPLWRSGRWPQDLYPGFRAFFAERSRDGEFGRLREAVLAAGTDRWDSHPSIGERIRLIMSEGGRWEPPGPPVPAWRVLADPARTEREMARLVASSATGAADVRPITWDRASADVLGPATAGTAERVRSAAIAVGGHWNRGGLDQALELLAAGRGADLARELDIDGHAKRGDFVLGGVLQATIATEIVERFGGRWSVSWSTGVGAEWAGTPVRELAQRALSGPQGIAAVRSELRLPQGAPLRRLPPLGVGARV